VRQALVDASGIASMLTTAEVVVVEKPEPKPKDAGGQYPGGMDMY